MAELLPTLPVLSSFIAAALVLAITPGPDMALFIARTLNYGRAHGFATVFGAVSGIAVHTILAAFGISVLIVAAPTAFWLLKIAGALYLLWLAIQAFRADIGLTIVRKTARSPRLVASFATGLGINLTNPKVALFFVTFLPQFVSAGDQNATTKLLILGAIFVATALPVVIGIVLCAGWLTRTLTRSARLQRGLNWGFGAVFATFAVTILTAQARN